MKVWSRILIYLLVIICLVQGFKLWESRELRDLREGEYRRISAKEEWLVGKYIEKILKPPEAPPGEVSGHIQSEVDLGNVVIDTARDTGSTSLFNWRKVDKGVEVSFKPIILDYYLYSGGGVYTKTSAGRITSTAADANSGQSCDNIVSGYFYANKTFSVNYGRRIFRGFYLGISGSHNSVGVGIITVF